MLENEGRVKATQEGQVLAQLFSGNAVETETGVLPARVPWRWGDETAPLHRWFLVTSLAVTRFFLNSMLGSLSSRL